MQLFDAVVFAHFVPGALAILMLFRRRGWAPAGAVIAAMIFMLGGSASARLQHTGMIFSYGFFPLALWLLEEALDHRSYRYAVLFAAVAAMMAVGPDQVAFLSALTLIGFVVHRIAIANDRLAFARSRLGVLAAAGIVGAALLAVPVVLTMQFLATSTRPSLGFGVAAVGSLPPSSLATMLFSDVFGSLRQTYDYWEPDWQRMDAATWTRRGPNCLFAGTIPALLLIWHGIAGGRLFARELRFFLILGVAAVFYALGRYTPVFALVFDHVPGVALYRRPADATFLINFAVAIAGGYLVHRWLGEGSPALARLRRPAGAAVAGLAALRVIVALLSALGYALRANHALDALRDVALAAAIAGIAATAVVKAGTTPSRRAAVASLIVAVTAGELLWRNAASPLNAEAAERYAVFRELPPEQLQGLQVLKKELAERNAKGERPRVEILGLGGAWQNASMVLGLEDTIGYNPLRLADYEKAVGPGENAVDPNLRTFPGTFRGYKCRLASLLGLEYLVLDRAIERLPPHFPRFGDAKLLYGSGTMWIYRLAPTAPRAYLATQLIPVDSESVLTEAELPDFDRTKAALIEQSHVSALSGDYGIRDTDAPATPAQGSVTITSYRRNAVILDVNTDRKSIVVLHDIYYPGWEATVDGKVQPILRTNVLFRGVEVPAGHHVVEFKFRPLSLGNLIAAATDLLDKDAGEGETVTR